MSKKIYVVTALEFINLYTEVEAESREEAERIIRDTGQADWQMSSHELSIDSVFEKGTDNVFDGITGRLK
jgi:tryptophanase